MLIRHAATIVGLSALSCMATMPAEAGGAIVSSPVKGKYYYMTHRPSASFAANLAMADCAGHHGGGCRVLKAYDQGCVAIAHGGGHSGWAVKSSGGAAEAFAQGQCEKYGSPCHIDVAVCE